LNVRITNTDMKKDRSLSVAFVNLNANDIKKVDDRETSLVLIYRAYLLQLSSITKKEADPENDHQQTKK